MKSKNVIIKVLDGQNDLLLDDVIQLGNMYRKTLGFFPKGAYEERANKRQIIAAVAEKNIVMGYLAYTVNASSLAKITHLCMDEKFRKQGIHARLVDCLVNRVSLSCHAIHLHCRRDYDIGYVWKKLGFIYADEKIAKQEGKILNHWIRELEHPNLLLDIQDECNDDSTILVIDANVFFDLESNGNNRSNEIEESKALLADWITPHIEMLVTPELLNEIGNNQDENIRKHSRSSYKRYGKVLASSQKAKQLSDKLKDCYLDRLSKGSLRSKDRAEADLRQLAWAIASSASIYVTRDTDVLGLADDIENQYNLSVYRPSEIISRLSDIHLESRDRRRSFKGNTLRIEEIKEDFSITQFCLSLHGEKSRLLSAEIQNFRARPDEFTIMALYVDGEMQGFWVSDYRDPKLVKIPLMRLRYADKKAHFTQTLISGIISVLLRQVVVQRRCGLFVEEQLLTDAMQSAFRERGFRKTGDGGWLKLCIDDIGTEEKLGKNLEEHTSIHPSISWGAEDKDFPKTIFDVSRLEHMFWPLKCVGKAVPTFIVPIRAAWARELFDDGLSGGMFPEFEAATDLALNWESAYYRANKPGVLRAPGRILWYVSQADSNGPQTMCIRACSRIIEIEKDIPAKLFKKYRRLGVYQWNDLMGVAENDEDKVIQAILFDDTELFDKPMKLNRVQAILQNQFTYPSPYELSEEVFFQIYRECRGK